MKPRVALSLSGTRQTSRRYGLLLMLAAVGFAVAIGGLTGAAGSTPPAACAQASASSSSQLRLTTIGTIEQAYDCIFAHYYSGPVLDDRTLLVGAFAGFTQELERLGIDNSYATLPTLDGNRQNDWTAFAAVYQQVESHLPASNTVRQALASATLTGMVSSLEDNHARWEYAPTPPNSSAADQYGLGLQTSPSLNLLTAAPAETVAPLFLTSIQGGPASRDHIRPGDIILSVNGVPPFANGLLSQGVIDLLFQSYPQDQPVRIAFHRPATGRTWTVKIRPTLYQPSAASSEFVTAQLLDGNIADINVSAFAPGVADAVLKAISRLGGRKLHGVILDLRGNSGGLPTEVSALLGAFAHDKAYSYDCTVRGSCTANYVDNTTPLLQLPLVVLTDRNCVSACEAFSAAVKDLHLGTLSRHSDRRYRRRAGNTVRPQRQQRPGPPRAPRTRSRPRTHQRHRRRPRLLPPPHRRRPLHRTRPRPRQGTEPPHPLNPRRPNRRSRPKRPPRIRTSATAMRSRAATFLTAVRLAKARFHDAPFDVLKGRAAPAGRAGCVAPACRWSAQKARPSDGLGAFGPRSRKTEPLCTGSQERELTRDISRWPLAGLLQPPGTLPRGRCSSRNGVTRSAPTA